MNGQLLQTTLFGAPEPVTSYPSSKDLRGRGDDMPVACERELLWPACLVAALVAEDLDEAAAVALLERLYGDVPRRTRLKIDECTRRLRCDRMTVHRHINETRELSAIDIGSGEQLPAWRVYRASFILFLVRREFGGDYTRTDARPEDAETISRAVVRVRKQHKQ